MGRRKGSKNSKVKKIEYFDSEVENAIIKYNNTEDRYERNQLYKIIEPALKKLVEFLIFKYKFFYFDTNMDDLRHDTITWCIEKIPMYTIEKGKAFSYFHIIGLRFLIRRNTNNYDNIASSLKITEAVEESVIYEEYEEPDSFLDIFIEYLDINNRFIFVKDNEYDIADSIVTIVRRRDKLDNLSKKAIFVYLKEMLQDETSVQITKVLKTLRAVYLELHRFYLDNEYIDSDYIPWGVISNFIPLNSNLIEYE